MRIRRTIAGTALWLCVAQLVALLLASHVNVVGVGVPVETRAREFAPRPSSRGEAPPG